MRNNALKVAILVAAGVIMAPIATMYGQRHARPTPKAYTTRDSAITQLFAAAPRLAEELRSLTPRQRAAVVSLVVLANAAVGYERAGVNSTPKLARPVLEQVGSLAPQPVSASVILSLLQSCLSYSIAYASAMASCERSGKREDQCPAAWRPASQEVSCMMKGVDGIRRFIDRMFSPLPGPRPFQ